MSNTNSPRGVQRVRHEARRRQLTVLRTARVTPGMLRVTLGGAELAGFVSAAADDHVKVFFPPPPGAPAAATAAGDPAAALAMARDFTPRRFDPERLELDIEFALHGTGPAAEWALQAAPGQQLSIGGPRGSFVLSGEFDWYLLVADETGLPAIARWLAELPATARAFVIAEVADAAEEQPFATAARLRCTWLHRGSAPAGRSERLLAALRAFDAPPGVGYTWIACESNVARALRQLLLAERGFDKRWVKASGYWKLGNAATHDKFDD